MATVATGTRQFDIVLEGWLQKKSKRINRWNRKWIILSTECIYTYKNKETKSSASEVIHLSDVTTVKMNTTDNMFLLMDKHSSIFQFQCEHSLHTKQWIQAITSYIKCIQIPVHVDCKRDVDYCCKFELGIPYNSSYKYTVHQLLCTITNHMQRQYPPIEFEPVEILNDSFIEKQIDYNSYDWKHSDLIVTDYTKASVIQKGMHILIDIAIHHHDVSSNHISCFHINHRKNICSVYSKMKCNTLFTKEALQHMQQYTHHHNEFSDKEPCKLDPCRAYQRVIHGGNDINDMCHLTVYKHAPRCNRIQSMQNIKCFALSVTPGETYHSLYGPTIEDMIECVYNEQDGYLKTFIAEIIRNGCKKHLYLTNDDRFRNKDNFTIMDAVQEKLDCVRHKQMGSPLNRSEMLSLILYTATDCCQSLCSAQSSGDYDKWKWFDYCLFNAIYKLSQREHGCYEIYTALDNIQLARDFIQCGYFKTYISTSWIKEIALLFINDNVKKNLLFAMDAEFREKCICCDISWVSKFCSNECEVLIARSIDAETNCFECKISKEFHLHLRNKIQTAHILPVGATEERSKEVMKYPLMENVHHTEEGDNNTLDIDILQDIDGITEDIIIGYLRRLMPQTYDRIPAVIRANVVLYYLDIYHSSTYLYPQYVSAKTLNAMLLMEPLRITKYPNVAFHENTQQLAIGATTADGHHLFVYMLDVIVSEMKLKSSKIRSSAITAVAFSKDGSYIVCYSAHESSLTVWDITNEQQQCIKECPIESVNKSYPLAVHLMHTKLTWSDDGVTLDLPEKKVLQFPTLKTSKSHKCLIFIVENMQKLRKSKFPFGKDNVQNTGDTTAESAITSDGIEDAFNLSRYINKHSSVKCTVDEKNSIETSIENALNMLKMDILSENNRNVLRNISPDLLSTCNELQNILEIATVKMQEFKDRKESETFGPLIDRQRTLIVSDYYKDMEEDDNAPNVLETTLKLQWVLDELISSDNNSIVLSSNQRRTVSTAMISLWDRFERDADEYIYLVPYLQDLGSNLSSETMITSATDFEQKCDKLDVDKLTTFYEKRLAIEPSLNSVNTKGFEEEHEKCERFCDWLFEITNDTVIICTNSEWFITFMNLYLSECANFSVAKTVPNCSVVGFRMVCDVIPDGSTKYEIIENSITNIYRGFK